MTIFDLHNDYPTSGEPCDKAFCPHVVVQAFWTSELIKPFDYINNYINNKNTTSGFCGKTSISTLYAIEDLWFASNSDMLEKVCKLPLMYASLTWNHQNLLAGGANSDGRLTALGANVATQLINCNVALDTAHLNRKSFYDCIELVENMHLNGNNQNQKPKIINSHTCLNSIYNHPRNLTDEQIKKIINLNGIIGLTPVAQFMRSDPHNADLTDYIKQIDTYAQKFGVANLAIGTDFYGAPLLSGLANYNDFKFLAQDLEKLGYSKYTINKIFYKNAYEFCLPT